MKEFYYSYGNTLCDNRGKSVASDKAARIINGLIDENLRLLDEIEDWKDATGLECGGDPDGVTPEALRILIGKLDYRIQYQEGTEKNNVKKNKTE